MQKVFPTTEVLYDHKNSWNHVLVDKSYILISWFILVSVLLYKIIFIPHYYIRKNEIDQYNLKTNLRTSCRYIAKEICIS